MSQKVLTLLTSSKTFQFERLNVLIYCYKIIELLMELKILGYANNACVVFCLFVFFNIGYVLYKLHFGHIFRGRFITVLCFSLLILYKITEYFFQQVTNETMTEPPLMTRRD